MFAPSENSGSRAFEQDLGLRPGQTARWSGGVNRTLAAILWLLCVDATAEVNGHGPGQVTEPPTVNHEVLAANGPGVDCADWNTMPFFKTATPEHLVVCLDAGADPNARRPGERPDTAAQCGQLQQRCGGSKGRSSRRARIPTRGIAPIRRPCTPQPTPETVQ